MVHRIGRAVILTLVFALLTPALEAGKGLPFIADDYGKALAQAKRQNLPIFVECWAPW
jgi:hypothetical protein